jgi:hypothetical protein
VKARAVFSPLPNATCAPTPPHDPQTTRTNSSKMSVRASIAVKTSHNNC